MNIIIIMRLESLIPKTKKPEIKLELKQMILKVKNN